MKPEDEKIKQIIIRLSLYLKECYLNRESDTFRGLNSRLGLEYCESQSYGILDFNNGVYDIVENIISKDKEIEELRKENKSLKEKIERIIMEMVEPARCLDCGSVEGTCNCDKDY